MPKTPKEVADEFNAKNPLPSFGFDDFPNNITMTMPELTPSLQILNAAEQVFWDAVFLKVLTACPDTPIRSVLRSIAGDSADVALRERRKRKIDTVVAPYPDTNVRPKAVTHNALLLTLLRQLVSESETTILEPARSFHLSRLIRAEIDNLESLEEKARADESP